MRKREMCRMFGFAYLWHGGGGSPLYSFASTRTIHGEDHRQRLEAEVKEALEGAKRREGKQLDRLLAFIKTAPINVELVTDDEYNAWAG